MVYVHVGFPGRLHYAARETTSESRVGISHRCIGRRLLLPLDSTWREDTEPLDDIQSRDSSGQFHIGEHLVAKNNLLNS